MNDRPQFRTIEACHPRDARIPIIDQAIDVARQLDKCEEREKLMKWAANFMLEKDRVSEAIAMAEREAAIKEAFKIK